MRLLLTLMLALLVAVLAACADDVDDQDAAVDADDQTEVADDTTADDHADMADDQDMADDDHSDMAADDHADMTMELDDETFLAAMIEHHEGAVDMAEIALDRAEQEELRQMAQEIIEAQEAEIDQMQAWLDEWFDGGHGDHGISHEEMGMDMDMDEFREAEPFDLAFIDEMIIHHEGAIDMARAILDTTERDELREMAEEIIEAQEEEIQQMREWRAEWFDS
ncbi:MAG: DUF305 domain-containing protein [Sphaerobacteraceae bacterium]|nr:MAG: DUF305 domain-containing protein [Sphaerobacteraceae bacterium]